MSDGDHLEPRPHASPGEGADRRQDKTGADLPVNVLPSTAEKRKTYPVGTGVLDYFPDAIAEVAHVSWAGNEQHNPGTPVHWDRSKSSDEADALIRHFLQRGARDKDGMRHSAKMAWRALALLQKELEADPNRESK